jgi:hypothetical protein
LIRTLIDMLRLRAGPQDLPPGAVPAITLSLVWLAQGMLTDRILDDAESAGRSLFAVLVQFAAVIALLNLRNRTARIPQTVSALAGTGIIFGLLALFLLLQLDPQTPQPGLALAYLGLFVWSLAVDGHIYRHALSIKMSLGVLVAVLIFAANYTLMRAVFG